MRANKGFTIIEFGVVIVIIGILAATALPRFVDLTGDAQTASVQAIGGAFGNGVNLSHASWIAQGATAGINSTALEGGITVGMNDTGWPENDAGGGGDGTITSAECILVWNSILSSAPAIAIDTSGEYQATVATPICTYTFNASAGRTIAYNSATGAVTITVP